VPVAPVLSQVVQVISSTYRPPSAQVSVMAFGLCVGYSQSQVFISAAAVEIGWLLGAMVLRRSVAPKAAAAAIATAAVALKLCGLFIAADRFFDSGDSF